MTETEEPSSLAQDASACAEVVADVDAYLLSANAALELAGVPTRLRRFNLDEVKELASRTPAEGERQRDYDHGYGVGYEHGIKESEKEIEKWHRIAMEAGAITCVGGRHIYPLKDEVKQLRAQVETASACAKFVKWALQDGSWQGGDLDGGSIQDKAEELGLIQKVPYDPEKHGESEFGAEPGDDWYVLSDAAAGLSNSSTEQTPEVKP